MTGALAGAAAALAAAGELSREEGARLAREELAKRAYREAEPTLLDVLWGWVTEWLDSLTGRMESAMPGGWWVLGPLLAVLAAVVIGMIVYARPARRARRAVRIDTTAPLTAADHRAAAERSAASGDYAEAIRERLRAVTRDLEERAIITPRPGRTATELATEASAELPDRRDDLFTAARVFNDVAYGERTATAEGYRVLRELDERVAASRPVDRGRRDRDTDEQGSDREARTAG
ncbi:hypothetical protein HNR23_000195 [Nocardiopsis mwathae]|uniref:Protein-glutamine gamma-glutamyltransferase-like C-terminal domain-containing protein n=1 Tax=Nocardiopsis mwathae TaxID=1472723 RepID=A0A7X0D3J4_9ACTN|nr:DUF4129 domain-containing protein [Nocardiopsis mwathae]MBB6170135.1 hypothetical protein [Nocardiopsis mwathae]